MVQENTDEEQPEVTPEVTPTEEPNKVSLHIYMLADGYEQIKKLARYAALEGLIEGHPRANFTDYCNFCFTLGEQYLKQFMLKKRGYK